MNYFAMFNEHKKVLQVTKMEHNYTHTAIRKFVQEDREQDFVIILV